VAEWGNQEVKRPKVQKVFRIEAATLIKQLSIRVRILNWNSHCRGAEEVEGVKSVLAKFVRNNIMCKKSSKRQNLT